MKNKLFLVICLGTLAFAVFIQNDFTRFLLGFEFLLWMALFVCARLLSRHIDKELAPPPPRSGREQEIPVEVQLVNHSSIPVSELRVEVKCRDEYTGAVQRLRSTAMLDSRDETLLRFILQTKHYGLLTVWGDKLLIGDPLGINFASCRFSPKTWEIAVLPELTAVQDSQTESDKAKRPLENGDGTDGRGQDPSAAYELRPYQEGEPLRNVHWKMTAKTDELMVKEFARDTEPMALVFLDLDTGGQNCSREQWDAFLETAASFAASQLAAENPFEVFWLDQQAQRKQVRVRHEGDAREMLTALLREKPHTGSAGEIAIKEKMTHEAYSAVVRINLWCEITREEAAR